MQPTITTSILFVEEGTASSVRGVEETIRAQGLFSSLYTDRGSHHWHTPESGGKADIEESDPIFGRLMRQLGTEMIPAYSTEAGGRSERTFHTQQDRLPKELAAAGITESKPIPGRGIRGERAARDGKSAPRLRPPRTPNRENNRTTYVLQHRTTLFVDNSGDHGPCRKKPRPATRRKPQPPRL